MSETNSEDAKELKHDDDDPKPSSEQEEEKIKKKYGGLLRKKHPLISKDHDHAFFDSADWALGKQGSQKSKGPLEELRPKLQPTPHLQARSRRSAYAHSGDSEEGDDHDEQCSPNEEGQEKTQDGSSGGGDDHPGEVTEREDRQDDQNTQKSMDKEHI